MSILRRKLGIRAVHGGRFYSTPAAALNDDVLSSFEWSVVSSSGASIKKLKGLARTLPSLTFADVALTDRKYLVDVNLSDKSYLIRLEIFNLVDTKHYQGLLDAMVKFSTLDDLASLLSPQEVSYVMGVLVNHQLNLLRKYAVSTHHENAPNSKELNSTFKLGRHFVYNIRQIYCNLLYKGTRGHLYETSKASFGSFDLAYDLTVKDFENLILLESRNGKLDLASVWFQRFQEYYRDDYPRKMTQNMWILKFQTFCGGLPHLWPSHHSSLYKSVPHSLRQSSLTSETSFITVFNEFLKYNSDQNKTSTVDLKLLMNNRFNETLIYSIGYSGNVTYLKKYIASMWGITEDGLVSSFTVPHATDINYPDYKILKSVLVSFSRNNEFFKAMKYINHFRDVYDINVSTNSSKSFWEQIFDWCDKATKYEESAVLSYYLRQTGVDVKSKQPKSKNPSLTEAQQNVNFDYEGYLNYITELKLTRNTTFAQLWQLYLESGSQLSLVAASRYHAYLTELMKERESFEEKKYYDFMSILLHQYHKFNIPKDSFNRRNDIGSKVSSIDQEIRKFYEQVLKTFIDYKWTATFAGQCQPLIRKWLIDNEMKQELSLWFQDVRMPEYQDMMNKKRQDFLISLRTEDEKESLLDLI